MATAALVLRPRRARIADSARAAGRKPPPGWLLGPAPLAASRGDMADPALAPRRSGAPLRPPWLAGCTLASGLSQLEPRPAPASAPARAAPAPRASEAPTTSEPVAPSNPAPPARTPPPLDHEPLLGVLLAGAPRVAIQLEAATTLEAPGLSIPVGPGALVVESRGERWGIEGDARALTGKGVLASGGRPIFALDALPIFGEPRRLTFDGDLVVSPSRGALEVVERVRMEDYVASVVGAEMNPKWPASALAAQAIVARSYAAARWMERADEPWQLHWHFGVDMAYHGWSASRASVASSIAATRGEVLVYSGFPVLALFNASSGGLTESFERAPGVLAPDGRLDRGRHAGGRRRRREPGAAASRLSSHGHWKTDHRCRGRARCSNGRSPPRSPGNRRGRGRVGARAPRGLRARRESASATASTAPSASPPSTGPTPSGRRPGARAARPLGPLRDRREGAGYFVLRAAASAAAAGSQSSAWCLATQGATPGRSWRASTPEPGSSGTEAPEAPAHWRSFSDDAPQAGRVIALAGHLLRREGEPRAPAATSTGERRIGGRVLSSVLRRFVRGSGRGPRHFAAPRPARAARTSRHGVPRWLPRRPTGCAVPSEVRARGRGKRWARPPRPGRRAA